MTHRLSGRPIRQMANRIGAIGLLAALLVLTGCASRKQVFLIQEDLQHIRANVDTLKHDQQMAQLSINSLDEQLRVMKAASEYGSSSLEEKVETLAARLDEILTRMDRSLAPLEDFIRRQDGGTDTCTTTTMGVDYYDAAVQDLGLGNYDLAEVGFIQFLENYPKSDLADDARYGLAETYYARKKYDQAIEEFRRVIAISPQGSKTPAAMLKMGLCHRALQNNRDATKAWEELILLFPHTEEAKVAQQRLDEIQNRP